MTIPTFTERARQWSAPPVDDVGYLLSEELLTWHDEALLDLINQMAVSRYQGWRNWEMRWRTVLGLDSTRDSDVLDYGCGVGLEALQYAKLGNRVTIADIGSRRRMDRQSRSKAARRSFSVTVRSSTRSQSMMRASIRSPRRRTR